MKIDQPSIKRKILLFCFCTINSLSFFVSKSLANIFLLQLKTGRTGSSEEHSANSAPEILKRTDEKRSREEKNKKRERRRKKKATKRIHARTKEVRYISFLILVSFFLLSTTFHLAILSRSCRFL